MARHSDWTDDPRDFRDELPTHVSGGSTTVVDRAEATFARRGESAINRFAARIRRLPTFARTYTSHEAVARGVPGDALGRIMRSLDGKFVVANRPASASLPNAVSDAIHKVQALGRQTTGARSISVSLDEPASAVIRQADRAGASTDSTSPAAFFALLPYQLTIVLDADSSANGESLVEAGRTLVASLVPDAVDWFNVGLCVPDRDAMQQMTGEAALFYRGITGRLGPGMPERYWHLDAWEQYTEPGRMHGFIVPEFLRLPQYSPSPAAHDQSQAGSGQSYGSSYWPPLTRRLVRRALIPPGYCFVEFWARVSVRVAAIVED